MAAIGLALLAGGQSQVKLMSSQVSPSLGNETNLFSNLLCQVEPIYVGHLDVKQDQVKVCLVHEA